MGLEKRGPLFLFRFFKFFKRQILLPAGFISHLYFFVINARSLPHLGQNLNETCKDSPHVEQKHGGEGRRRSCVTVPFSLPTLGVLGRMCREDVEMCCEDFEMCCEDFRICTEFKMCCEEFGMCFEEFGIKCVVHNLKCVFNNSKYVVR